MFDMSYKNTESFKINHVGHTCTYINVYSCYANFCYALHTFIPCLLYNCL